MTAGLYQRVMVVSTEAGSVGLHPDNLETQALIGDGAAAALLVPATDGACIESVHFETFGQGAALTQILGGGSRHPPQDTNTTLAHNTFSMDGLGLIKLVLRRLPGFLERALPEGLDTFDHIVPHQASPATFRVLERVGAPMAKVHSTLETLGNCIAASIPLTLEQGVRAGRIQRGERVLLIGTGAGVSIGAVSLRF